MRSNKCQTGSLVWIAHVARFFKFDLAIPLVMQHEEDVKLSGSRSCCRGSVGASKILFAHAFDQAEPRIGGQRLFRRFGFPRPGWFSRLFCAHWKLGCGIKGKSSSKGYGRWRVDISPGLSGRRILPPGRGEFANCMDRLGSKWIVVLLLVVHAWFVQCQCCDASTVKI